MSANSAAHGTSHFKQHSLAGWGVIIGLPFAIAQVIFNLPYGAPGLIAWLTSPLGAIGMSLFLSAVILYVKLELDEVFIDYTSGGMRQFGQLANRLVALILWVASVGALLFGAFG